MQVEVIEPITEQFLTNLGFIKDRNSHKIILSIETQAGTISCGTHVKLAGTDPDVDGFGIVQKIEPQIGQRFGENIYDVFIHWQDDDEVIKTPSSCFGKTVVIIDSK